MLTDAKHIGRVSVIASLFVLVHCVTVRASEAVAQARNADTSQTVALWLFDEQIGIYPSCVLSDQSDTDLSLILGPGGEIVPGQFGNALEPVDRKPIPLPQAAVPEGAVRFGLAAPEKIPGRRVAPLTWRNAKFSALTTQGQNHLRKHVRLKNPTQTGVNLGRFDWTVEFRFRGTSNTGEEGVVFELGEGPRGENDHVTRLVLNAGRSGFSLFNQTSGTRLVIPSDPNGLTPSADSWHHLAFVYTAAERQLRHFVDGVRQELPEECAIESLAEGDEAYLSIGRDGQWRRRLGGRIDELRFSTGARYLAGFDVPDSFDSNADRRPYDLTKGPPLLFGKNSPGPGVVRLGGRKHVFIDDALISEKENVALTVNPPRMAERVIAGLKARKHLTVIEDEKGLIRLYYPGPGDRLAVMTSEDGVHFQRPRINTGVPENEVNIINFDETGVGSVFLDPNAPENERWKFVSGFDDRGIFVYSSPDGWSFHRDKTAALPFRSGSQSVGFYDDQRQTYVTFERTGFATFESGQTRRRFVRTETKDLHKPWPFHPVSLKQTLEVAARMPLKPLRPYYLDNGPLTPGGFGLEYPFAFGPRDGFDPAGASIYVPKAIKYAWAADTYVAFPTVYFNYHGDGPETQQALGDENRGRGSGPSEVQMAVSRDGMHWTRYPRPTYVGIGPHHGQDDHEIYMVQGLVRRGNEIWQYFFGRTAYHSSWIRKEYDSVFRVVQRLDGFVSADAAYTGGWLKTRPLIFKGSRLVLNIDTDASGYAQVGILDATGQSIPGYDVDDCIYINGDFIASEVEWKDKGKSVAELAGKPVQLVFRMRGSKLYSMQFAEP